MKRPAALLLIAALAARAVAALNPLPVAHEHWFADPITWKFRADGIHCAISNAHGIAVYEAAPLSEEVTVEALFTPSAADRTGWAIASVAIVEDERNYWHLALVQTPPEQGCTPWVELTEMRAGHWLAQHNLRQSVNEAPAGRAWAFGQPHRLTLSMDKAGVTGTILGPDGQLILRRRFDFTAAAVTRGRPAVRVGGFRGTFSDIKAAWGAPVPAAPSAAIPPYAVENAVAKVTDTATGFFRVVRKPDNRWWAIDPLGRGTVLLGVDHVTFHGHWCEKLGYAPHGRKNKAKYPDKAVWEEETLARLKAWGFNMLGAGCDPALKHRGLIHTEFLNIGDHLASLGDEYDITPNEHRPCSSFPNVFHPDFEAFSRYRARLKCAPHREDPWLFGYFIDNELAWWGRGGLEHGLFDAVMKKGPAHTAKLALRDFAARQAGNDLAAFNAFWGTRLDSFDALLALDALPNATPAQREVKRDFLRLVADRYFAVTTRAIRDVDPNHLVLGARFAGTGGADPAVWEISGKYCEVVTFNCYPMADLDEGVVYTHFGKTGERVTDHFATYYNHVKRPMLITEWSFPALDAGLPSVHGAGQRFRTQAERTAATRLFARTMLSLPFLLGYDYFMWVDEPALGISTPFPEDSNYGLINEDGVPYTLLTEMFADLHREAARWRSEPAPAPLAAPAAAPMPDALSVARRAAAPSQAAAFTRDGDAFRASNGRLELAGQLGPGRMIRRVTLDGAPAPSGQYNAMLHTLGPGGQNRWTDTHTVKSVEGRVADGIAVIEITSVGAHGQDAFEVTHRILLPPGTPWFVCEVLRVTNTGPAPLALKSLYFRLLSDFSGLPEKLPPNLWGVPPSGCWLDTAEGRFFGAVAPRRSGILIHFWIDATHGSRHPDARLELDIPPLAPGATFTPSDPVYLLSVAGTGGAAGWQDATHALGKLLTP